MKNTMKNNAMELAYGGHSLDEIYIQLERYINNGSPSGFGLDMPSQYLPSSFNSRIKVPYFTAPSDDHLLIGQIPVSAYPETGHLPFYVHPHIVNTIKGFKCLVQHSDKQIHTEPTASGRTMWVDDGISTPWFLKLHFPFVLGRFSRELSLFKWLAALERSKELMYFSDRFPKSLALLEDFGGTYHQSDMQTSNFGTIFRGSRPFPYSNQKCLLIPSFSLFADPKLNRSQSVMADIVQTLGLSFNGFLDLFVVPVFESYIFLITEVGLIPEFNSQNVLFEFDLKKKTTRLVVRDHGDSFVDHNIRREKGLHRSFCSYKSIDMDDDSDYFQRRSFSFDFKLSYYLLNPILKEYCSVTGYSYTSGVESVRVLFNDLFRDIDGYFGSKKWYSYSNKSKVSRSSYIENEDPLFR